MGLTGPNPMLAAALGAIGMALLSKPKAVIVTDRAVLVCQSSPWKQSTVKAVEARLPRATAIGPLSGTWGSTTVLTPEKLWIHERFHKDVGAADAELSGQTA